MHPEAPPSPPPPPAGRPSRQVPCPTCGRPARFAPDNPWRPFCTERCRSVDLGAWAEERYRVAAQGDAGLGEANTSPDGPG